MDKNYTVKSKQLACTMDGNPNNPPIILIHDLASYRGVWRQTISKLQENYYCVAVDLLGFGASDKSAGSDFSLSAQATRILMLADQLGFKKFSLIGHSMGGQIALYLASVLAPLRVEKIVIVAGIVTGRFSEKFEKDTVTFIKNARKWPWLYGLAKGLVNFPFIAKSVFKQYFYDVNSLPFDSWISDRNSALNPASATSADESCKAIHALDLTQYLRKIRAQTLIIAGKQDAIVPMDQALLAQTLIPKNDLALIEKCGHFPMYEKPVNFMKALALIFK